jgi:orotidine-5'-phosphate decarboxylase
MTDLSNVPRWRGLLDDRPRPTVPFIFDIHTFDVPNTIRNLVRGVHKDVVAIVLVDRGGPEMREAAEQAARERGVVILWEDRVADAEAFDPAFPRMVMEEP